jgi:hypothetical protein
LEAKKPNHLKRAKYAIPTLIVIVAFTATFGYYFSLEEARLAEFQREHQEWLSQSTGLLKIVNYSPYNFTVNSIQYGASGTIELTASGLMNVSVVNAGVTIRKVSLYCPLNYTVILVIQQEGELLGVMGDSTDILDEISGALQTLGSPKGQLQVDSITASTTTINVYIRNRGSSVVNVDAIYIDGDAASSVTPALSKAIDVGGVQGFTLGSLTLTQGHFYLVTVVCADGITISQSVKAESQTSGAPKGQLQIDSITAIAGEPGTITVYVRNLGGNTAKIDAVYVEGTKVAPTYLAGNSDTIGVGEVTGFTLSYTMTQGHFYKVTVVCADGTTISQSVKAQ